MFKISRTEQFIIYYWTGSDWSTRTANAKQFNSEAEARAEMSAHKIAYTYSITPRKTVSQSSIQLDDQTRQQIADLAEWWGLPDARNTTAVIRRLVAEAHARESARRELQRMMKR